MRGGSASFSFARMTLRGRDLGALTEAAGRSLEAPELQFLKLAAQVGPGVPAAGLGDADEKQGQPAEHDVSADALLLAVADRPQADGELP